MRSRATALANTRPSWLLGHCASKMRSGWSRRGGKRCAGPAGRVPGVETMQVEDDDGVDALAERVAVAPTGG